MFPFKFAPMAHQFEDFQRFKDAKAIPLFWEMGTGKTKELIDIAGHKYMTGQIDAVVVIAPNTVYEQWTDKEIPKHCAVPFTAFSYQNKDTNKYQQSFFEFLSGVENKEKLHFFAIYTDAFVTEKVNSALRRFCEGKRVLMVVDEATRIKNMETKTHKNILAARNRHATCVSVLTGTALAKRPTDAYGIVEFVHPGFFGMSYAAFCRRHCIQMRQRVEFVRNGRTIRTTVDAIISEKVYNIVRSDIVKRINEAYRNLLPEEVTALAVRYELAESDIKFIMDNPAYTKYKNVGLLKQELATIASFRKKDECTDLPEKVYEEIVLPLNPSQKKVINQMKEYAVALYGDLELTILQKQTLQTRALQVCGGFFPYVKEITTDDKAKYATVKMEEPNAKLNYILQDLEELDGGAFIIWAVFSDELRMLHEVLGKETTVALLSGDTPLSQRAEIRDAFLNGEIQGLVANPSVAGFGMNFQHATVQYWYSRNYRTEARLQAEDRSHRIGITKSPVYKDLIYDCAFERKVLQDNKAGKEMNDYFNSAPITELFKV